MVNIVDKMISFSFTKKSSVLDSDWLEGVSWSSDKTIKNYKILQLKIIIYKSKIVIYSLQTP
jgi:hypothetical protein